MISRDACPRTQRKPRLSGFSGIAPDADQPAILDVDQHPAQRGWQFMGHIVRNVSGPLAAASI